MAELAEQVKRVRQIQWRKLLNVRDASDILSLVGSLSRILNQRGQLAVGQVGHGIRETRVLEDVINVVDRLGKLVVRKTHEFEQKGVEAVHTVEQEVRESPVVERIEKIHRQEKVQEPPPKGDSNVFVVGAVIGTLIGAVIALWFAPRSGEATRQEIEQTAQDMRRRVEGESIQDAIEAGKAEARRLQQTGNSR